MLKNLKRILDVENKKTLQRFAYLKNKKCPLNLQINLIKKSKQKDKI